MQLGVEPVAGLRDPDPLGDWTPFINLAEVHWGGSFTELGHSIRGNGTVGGALPRGRWFRVTAYYDHPRFVLWIDGDLVWDGEASAQIQMNAFHWGAYSGDGADGIVRNDDIQLCTGTKNLALGEPSCGPGPPPPPPDDVCDAADISSDGYESSSASSSPASVLSGSSHGS